MWCQCVEEKKTMKWKGIEMKWNEIESEMKWNEIEMAVIST